MLERDELSLLNVLPLSRAPELVESLATWGIPAWRLDGRDVDSATAFFAASGRDLPSPFGIRPVSDWDAFGDNLWEAAAMAEGDTAAFVWEGAHALLRASVADFAAALVALHSFARRLANPASPGTQPKLMYLFILGEGPNFGT